MRKLSILRKFRDAIVNRAFAVIGKRFFLQLGNQLHHIVDMVGSPNPMFRRFNAQHFAIVKKSLHKFFGVFPNAHAGRRGIGNNPIVHIGQIHHMQHLEAAQLQKSPQNILKHKRPKISNVRIVVNRRPARIHAHFAGALRNKRLRLAAHRIVQTNFSHAP